MIPIKNKITWKIFNPVWNQFYKMGIPGSLGASACCSNHGWFLMYQKDQNIFLSNPSTAEKVVLPDIPRFDGIYPVRPQTMSFSSPPTCSDCLVVGVSQFYGRGYGKTAGYIAILKRGGEWKIHKVRDGNNFILDICSPVFHKGRMYCLDIEGYLGTFNPPKEDEDDYNNWTVYPASLPVPDKFTVYDIDGQRFLVTYNGELTVVCAPRSEGHVRVFKWYDRSKSWQIVKSLRDKMVLFASLGASYSEKAVVRGMGNKIYFPLFHANNGVFYSLTKRVFGSFYDDYMCELTEYFKVFGLNLIC